MSHWPSAKARAVLSALLKIGWTVKRQTGSHRTLSRPGWQAFVFAFHEGEEIGPRMLDASRSTRGSLLTIYKTLTIRRTW